MEFSKYNIVVNDYPQKDYSMIYNLFTHRTGRRIAGNGREPDVVLVREKLRRVQIVLAGGQRGLSEVLAQKYRRRDRIDGFNRLLRLSEQQAADRQWLS